MTIDAKTFIQTASKEQMDIIFALSDLGEEESRLAKKINAILESAKKDGICRVGEGITICESDDDIAIITSEDREKLNSVRKQMAALLKNAHDEMGMQNVGIIQRQYENYKEFLTET